MTLIINIIIKISIYGTLAACFIFILKNPEIIDKWSNLYYRFAFWLGKKREKRILSSDIDYRITTAAKKINHEEDGILPFGIRIKWQDPQNIESFVQKDKVVIILRKDENIDRSIVDACKAFVPQALLPKARIIIDSDVLKSIDHHIIKKILSTGKYTSAYNYYASKVIDNDIKKNYQIKKYIEEISIIDEKGLLTRILLKEFKLLGDLLYGTHEEYKYRGETRDFLQFVYDISKRNPGDDTTNLRFVGKKIKIGLILVAKQATLEHWGIKAYLKRIEKYHEQGIDRVFILSYSQIYDEVILNRNSYVKNVKRRRSFIALSQIETECRKLKYMKLIKKQHYYAKDQNNLRSAKYYIYQLL